MWQYKSTDELYHYGVKGMKWGRRRKYSLLPSQGVQTYGRVPVTSPVGKSDAYAGRTPTTGGAAANRPVARKKKVGGVSNGVKTGKKLTDKEHGDGSTVGDDHDAYGMNHPVLGGGLSTPSSKAAAQRIRKKTTEYNRKNRKKMKAEKIYLSNANNPLPDAGAHNQNSLNTAESHPYIKTGLQEIDKKKLKKARNYLGKIS